MPDEIVEFKPGVGPFKLNVVALLKKLALKSKIDPVAVVARRFLQIFQDHGVPATQIPRLVPQISLDKLSTTEALLSALNGDVLEHTAKLFQIRRTWLEGVGDQIYDTVWCYKDPERFFQELATLEMQDVAYPIVALCSSRRLDGRSDDNQPIALLFREKVCDLGDEEIHRYRIFGDGWDWGYWKSRIQLKAMARMVDKVLNDRIPMYQVKPVVLKAVESGNRVPRQCLRGPQLDNMSLEDFALSPSETAQSKEAEELSQVIEYIKYHDLESAAKRALKGKL
jgi:hypothetical protein